MYHVPAWILTCRKATVHEMERKDDREDGSSKVANLLNLPVELLVYILSFLSTVRDKVK